MDGGLERVLADYRAALARGEKPDRARLLAEHPELADALHQAFCEDDRATARVQAGNFPAPFGDYELLQELGRGGMGVVYKARHSKLGRTVALKMILGGKLASPDDRRRFRTEVEATASLDHPQIVPIFEVGESGGQQYFTTKFMEEGSVDRHLDRLRARPRVAARLVATVARAVHHAHQHGFLHRDLKPANILLDGSLQPHVTDFGLALRVDADRRMTTDGFVVGTASYMAPEQARGDKRLTTAVDVWALGAILYEILTGKVPFEGATPVETLRQVEEQDPVAPRALNPKVDRDLERIILKCLEKAPKNRYGSAEALAEDLERWMEGRPVVARPVGGAARAWRLVLRRPGTAALALSTALLLAVVVFEAASRLLARRAQAAQLEASAETVARYFQGQWEAWGRAVADGACQPELREALRQHRDARERGVPDADPDQARRRAALKRILAEKFQEEFRDRFRGSARLPYPFDSWHLHERDGLMLAHSMDPGDSLLAMAGRDYLRVEPGESRVSTVYESKLRGPLDKFALSAAVVSGTERLGTLVASITTAPDPGLELLPEPFAAFVIGPSEADPAAWKVILHRGYRPGDRAWTAPPPPPGGGLVEAYPDPRNPSSRHPTAFARVGATRFLVAVQKLR